MILVVGATGLLGFEIVSRLRAHEHAVRALTRTSSSKSSALDALGVERVTGDLKDRASLESACRGQETVVSTASATVHHSRGNSIRAVDRDGQLALMEAARAAGVRRFVYVSVSPNLQPTCALVRHKREVEAAVRASGMEWVILQPAAFMEIWLSPLLGWDLKQGRARVFGRGDTRASLVSMNDVAAFAVASVEQVDLRNQDLPVGGPEPVTPNQVVALGQALTGRLFRVQRIPAVVPRVLSSLLRSVAPLPASLMDMAAQMAERDDVIDSGEAAAALGITPTSLRDFAIRAATADQGSPPETSEA